MANYNNRNNSAKKTTSTNNSKKTAMSQNKKMIIIASIVVGVIILAIIGGVMVSNSNQSSGDKLPNQFDGTNPQATIEMENGDKIVVELYPNQAPNTVDNFISLANNGFYDGLNFHRVIEGFMIQGGCPLGNGMGDPGYEIAGEFSANGFENTLSHEAGVISMGRATPYDSAGSQFFIVHKNSPHLDGNYSGFGKVISGMEVVNEIATTEKKGEAPVEPQVIKTITINTFGQDFPEPVVVGAAE